MNKFWIAVGTVVLLSFLTYPAIGQRLVEPNALKMSPAAYKNSYIKFQDVFIHFRAGVPAALSRAGYTLDKYITFGAAKVGMKCFMRRNSASEKLMAQFHKGDRITIYGYVKQPRIRRETRSNLKLENYIIEVSKVEKGWN